MQECGWLIKERLGCCDAPTPTQMNAVRAVGTQDQRAGERSGRAVFFFYHWRAVKDSVCNFQALFEGMNGFKLKLRPYKREENDDAPNKKRDCSCKTQKMENKLTFRITAYCHYIHQANLKMILSMTDFDFEVGLVKPEEGHPGSSAGRPTGEARCEVSGSPVYRRLLTVDNLRGG